jgi:hypothetical protein
MERGEVMERGLPGPQRVRNQFQPWEFGEMNPSVRISDFSEVEWLLE